MSDYIDEVLSELGPDAEAAIREKNAIKMEALQHLWRAIPYGLEFELSNGMTGRIKKFVEPRDTRTVAVGPDGREPDDPNMDPDTPTKEIQINPEAGVDIQLLKDGEHVGEIEFMITNTGWGMSLMAKDQ